MAASQSFRGRYAAGVDQSAARTGPGRFDYYVRIVGEIARQIADRADFNCGRCDGEAERGGYHAVDFRSCAAMGEKTQTTEQVVVGKASDIETFAEKILADRG